MTAQIIPFSRAEVAHERQAQREADFANDLARFFHSVRLACGSDHLVATYPLVIINAFLDESGPTETADFLMELRDQ